MKKVKITISPQFIFSVVGMNLIMAKEEPGKELSWSSLKKILPHAYESWSKRSETNKVAYIEDMGITLQKYYGFKNEEETVVYVLELAKKNLLPLLTN